jgi:hypothetical protein
MVAVLVAGTDTLQIIGENSLGFSLLVAVVAQLTRQLKAGCVAAIYGARPGPFQQDIPWDVMMTVGEASRICRTRHSYSPASAVSVARGRCDYFCQYVVNFGGASIGPDRA